MKGTPSSKQGKRFVVGRKVAQGEAGRVALGKIGCSDEIIQPFGAIIAYMATPVWGRNINLA